MSEQQTIEVMGVTLECDGDDTWKGKSGDSSLMAFGPLWRSKSYAPLPIPNGMAWSVLMSCEIRDATIQLYGKGATLDDAVHDLRGRLNTLTETRATIGADLAAMLDAGEVAA